MSSGSIIDNVGNNDMCKSPVFSLVSILVITATASVSDPVPAVVVIATIGNGF